jgi:hypothetical protein
MQSTPPVDRASDARAVAVISEMTNVRPARAAAAAIPSGVPVPSDRDSERNRHDDV